MNTHVKGILRAFLLAVGLLASTAGLAWHGGGGGGGWHGGGWGGGGWHGGGGYYRGGGWGGGGGWWGPGVVVGVPLGYGGYYGSACQRVQVCNPYGRCWIRRYCD